ncbi:hypothetical protein CDL15_Pgr001802 [Punica granatum]|uniref:peptidylprolyl isomerase n=1 Tax=Punica granatum TaxID=22663 RepID=A0A218XBR5_PUNGR|nr:hypothetical protein CDL15_Pgr001802 [Punica granatum]
MATIPTLTLSAPKLNTSSSSYLKPNSPASLSVVHCCSSSSSSSPCPSSVQSGKSLINAGVGFLAAAVLGLSPLKADATRVEYYATVGEPLCELSYAKSGLGYCDVTVGSGEEVPRGELVNVHYTARFADGTVFDSSYKRARPLTMRVIKGLDQGIIGGNGVPPMQVGGKRKLRIPPELAYGPEPAGCFSGDCNIPANATLLYDINLIGIYSGNAK